MLNRVILAALIAAAPVSVAVQDGGDADDYERTRLSVAAGLGQYSLLSQSCSNSGIRTPVHFVDVGGEISHRVSPHWLIGLRAGVLTDEFQYPAPIVGSGVPILPDETRSNTYVNPFVAYDARQWGFGVGYVGSEKQFVTPKERTSDIPVSAHLRLGAADGARLTLGFMEDIPLYTSGGYFTVIAGFPVGSSDQLAAGLSVVGPYDASGFLARWDHTFPSATSIGVRGRFGWDEISQFEGGVGVQLTQGWR